MRDVAAERAHERVEQPLRRVDERGSPGGCEHFAERPDRAADVVADVRVVEPAAVVAHEVPHAGAAGVARVAEERQRAVEDGRPRPLGGAPIELERDDGEAGDVVDAVPGHAVRDRAVRVLDDPAVVDEREQVIGAGVRECRARRAAIGGRRGATATAWRSAAAVASPIAGHCERLADALRLAARVRAASRATRCTSHTAAPSASASPKSTRVPAPEASMSCAYQYGVETAAQPAASAKVSEPDELCSRFA